MNRIVIRLGIFLLALIASPAILVEASSHVQEPDTIRTVLLGAEPDYPPYCLLDENGKPVGFAVDLFRAAAEAVHLNVKVKLGPWVSLKKDLAEGAIEALPIMGRTPEREVLYDFTIPYIQLHGAIFVRRDNQDIHTLADLKNKEILVMKGDVADEFVRRERISDRIYTTTTFDEAFTKLAAGEGDAVITQRIIGLKIMERLNLQTVVPLKAPLPEFRQEFCFAVQKGNEALLAQLNEGLSIVMANGTYKAIHQKWFGTAFQEHFTKADLLRLVLWIFVPLLVVLSLLWIVLLRKEVGKRTRHLNEEIIEHKKTWRVLQEQQSRLKESEEQIRLLLNSTAEGIYGTDTRGNCTFINQSALKALGYEDRSQVIGRNMHKLIHHTKTDGSYYETAACDIRRAFSSGTGIHNEDDVFWRADGSCFPTEFFSYPIHKNEEIVGLVVTFWDITERKRSERELLALKANLEIEVAQRTAELEEKVQKLDKSQRALLYMVEDLNQVSKEVNEERRKLELSNKELDAFTYSVSHDLRAPLRAINGYSDFLLEDYADKLDDEGKRFLRVIQNNASKMDRLITDMLNLSRISRAEMRMSKVDMGKVAKSIFQELASRKEQEQFVLEISAMPEIACDYSLIKQVWQNLIGNALKYSEKSGVKKIEIGSWEEGGEQVFFIRDYGAGFNPKYQDKLFGVFQRLHTEEEFKGTGVGLAIVQRIVSRHGGQVWAKSELQEGATFYFSLNGA
ncbi:transporter substrate-binding domain-containing protein [Sunxiuqinia rutila]|uniref:transporter substrate-binding domain-containing protein n=1 Tax=Sunxiuqinia rutila TaxID=1397841 RepID=UPI003D35BF82